MSRQLAQDPYPWYADLRARYAPHVPHRSLLLDSWLFAHHADVDRILRDHRRFSNNPRTGRMSRSRRNSLPDENSYTMLFLDPPDHTRLRSLVNKAFTPRAVNRLEGRVRALAHQLFDDIPDPSAFDLMQAIANPLPVIVIAEMLGVPPEDRVRFGVWSNQRARILEPTITPAERKVADEAALALDAYFDPIIEQRRREPRDDIMSSLVHAEEEGERLTGRELFLMLRLLLAAGNETTTNLIGNGMLALLRHPGTLERLRDDPGLIAGAIEELLRYDSPVQTDFRQVSEDCEVGGFPLRRTDHVVLLIGAANRDGAAFPHPDRLDIERGARTHLSFGRGIHHCLGAPLARLETRVFLETLVERFSSMRLLEERPEFRNTIVLRGLRALPVSAVPA